ncbi:hypothetical protein TIFTF001_052547, partial [Ficus carica]
NQTWFTVHPVSLVILSHPCLFYCSPISCSSTPAPICCLLVALLPVPPNPSTICCLPGPPFTGHPSSLPFAYIVDLLASPTSREADAALVGVCEAKANPWADYLLFLSSEIISSTRLFLP